MYLPHKTIYTAYPDNLMAYLVDGDEVRLRIDMDFTNFAQGPQYHYVPPNEMWLDKYGLDEAPFYVQHMLTERFWLAKGETDERAEKLAAISEGAMRNRVDGPIPADLAQAVKKEYRGKFLGYDSWLVDGRKVRRAHPRFTLGGNFAVYDYIPENTLWVDDRASLFGRKADELHEGIECHKMLDEGWDYPPAHRYANSKEKPYRQRYANDPMSALPDTYRSGG